LNSLEWQAYIEADPSELGVSYVAYEITVDGVTRRHLYPVSIVPPDERRPPRSNAIERMPLR
jgi:hypothetical protein